MNIRNVSMALLLIISLAGCASPNSNSTASASANASDTRAMSKPSQVVRYHHEVVSEDSEGDTKFLRLVPDNGSPSWP